MKLIEYILNWSKNRTLKYGAQYKTFGIFGIINYPLSYFYEIYHQDIFTTNYSWIRLAVSILCLLLCLKDKWPDNYKHYLPFLYHLTITIAIPIFSALMLCQNSLSMSWLMNFNIGIMIMILLLDSITFLIIEVVGISTGIIIFYLSGNSIDHMPSPEELNLFLYMFTCITILGTIFSRNKEVFHDYIAKLKDDMNQKLEIMVEERTADLTQALAARTDFLNNMSHEVRTPIQGIVNISQGLVDYWQDYPDQEKLFYAKKVAQNCNRLISLVSNLLDLSKFGADRMKYTVCKADLVALVYEMIREAKDLYIGSKPIEISFTHPQVENAMMICDEEKINQVLRNLFANAIKFTKEGKLEATLKKIEDTFYSKTEVDGNINNRGREFGYIFSLKDQGVGIPIGEEEAVFEPFMQSTRTKNKAGGTGLGLAICKKIVEAHRGTISAQNNLDIGTTFTFTIPEAYVNNNKDEYMIKDENNIDDMHEIEHYIEQQQDGNQPNDNQQKTILIIDDEEASHDSLSMILAQTDYKLLHAYGGVEGLQMLKENANEIDMVLLDLMMPDIYGLNLLQIIRQDDKLKKMKVILQTGASDDEEIAKAHILGIHDIITKPYNKKNIPFILTKSL